MRPFMLTLFALASGLLSQDVAAQDFDAMERRLGEAVGDGIINLEQATVMMRALRREFGDAGDHDGSLPDIPPMDDSLEFLRHQRQRMLERRNGLGRRVREERRRIEEAVAAGEMTEDDARVKMERIESNAKRAMMGLELRAAVMRGDLTPEEAREKSRAMRGKQARHDLHLAFRELKVPDKLLGEIKETMAENQFEHEQIEQSLGAMLRVLHQLSTEEVRDDKLYAKVRQHLQDEVKLSAEQMGVIESSLEKLMDQLDIAID